MKTKKVKVTTKFPEWPFARQTPGHTGVWGKYRFLTDQDVPECDCWVVFDDLMHEEKTLCYPANTILIAGEPAMYKTYNERFVSQFGMVVTQKRNDIKHPNVIFRAQGHPWHVGRKVRNEINLGFRLGYDELKSITAIPKTKCISVISSDHHRVEGHRNRFNFVRRLKDYFGDELDVFGRGIRDIEDKWKGIADYKYHIVVENCACEHWITEKLWDSYLGLSFPFYYGAPNINEYFSPDSFITIDIKDMEGSVQIMKRAIENKEYEKSIEALKISRDLVLDEYNFFPMIAKICGQLKYYGQKEIIDIQPHAVFQREPTIAKRITNKIARTWHDTIRKHFA